MTSSIFSYTAKDIVRGTGTITYLDFEGGFYGIVADDNARYDPEQLDETFQQDGLRVQFEVRILKGVMSTRMWGRPVGIISLVTLQE